jgi:hypothetical protein
MDCLFNSALGVLELVGTAGVPSAFQMGWSGLGMQPI